MFKQSSKVAVLTGGNRGIGLHVLKKLLICEMTVILGKHQLTPRRLTLACRYTCLARNINKSKISICLKGVRDPEVSKKLVEQELDESLTKGKVFYEKCDTGDFQSVREFAMKVKKQVSAIHLLINNGERE